MDEQENGTRGSVAAAVLPLLTSLPLTSSALLPLLSSHRPFVRPSNLPSSATKFVARINNAILSRDATGVEDKLVALSIARELVLQDTEGWVLAGWGKGWVGSTLGALSSSTTSLNTVMPHLALLQILVLAAPQSPSFERESVYPIMGKLSTTLLKLMERSVGQLQDDQEVLYEVLQSTRQILLHSPAAFRPAINTLRSTLLPLIVYNGSLVSGEVRDAAVRLLTSLYHTQGKAQVAQGWRAEMGDAMQGIGACLDAIVVDGWQADARAAQTVLPPGLAPFPADAPSRLPTALYALEGYTEIVLALLGQTTSRPVPVPIAHIIRLAIRCLDLTLDASTVPYISPQHHANLVAALPSLWTTGMILLGSLATSCGDHLLPHLTDILDTTLHLAESTPESFTQSHTQLLRLHNLFLNIYPSATWHPDHPTRLLKVCIGKLSPLLEAATPASANLITANGAGGKKGKKRARGEEDGLLASLEGREGRRVGVEGAVALESLRLHAKLHATPLLPASLLMLSIRLHLSLYLSLPTFGARRFEDPSIQVRLTRAVKITLESACLMVEDGGHSQGWKSVVMSVLEPNQGSLSPLLHPQLPALLRPTPPLSALHFFTVETEEEAKLREELGLGTVSDETQDEDDAMETIIVPVAPNDVRSGKKDISDVTLPQPIPGHTILRTLDAPQPGHYPPTTLPVTQSSTSLPPAAESSSVRPAELSITNKQTVPVPAMKQTEDIMAEGSGMGDEEFVSFDTLPAESEVKKSGKESNKMEVDDDSDEGIPDLDSELSGFEDDDEDDDEDINGD